LLAMRAVSHLSRKCGYEVSLRSLFEAPTIAQLAGEIEKVGARRKTPPADPFAGDAGLEEGSI